MIIDLFIHSSEITATLDKKICATFIDLQTLKQQIIHKQDGLPIIYHIMPLNLGLIACTTADIWQQETVYVQQLICTEGIAILQFGICLIVGSTMCCTTEGLRATCNVKSECKEKCAFQLHYIYQVCVRMALLIYMKQGCHCHCRYV